MSEQINQSFFTTPSYRLRTLVNVTAADPLPTTYGGVAYDASLGFKLDLSAHMRAFDNAVQIIVAPAGAEAGSVTIQDVGKTLKLVIGWPADSQAGHLLNHIYLIPVCGNWRSTQWITTVPPAKVETFWKWSYCPKELYVAPEAGTAFTIILVATQWMNVYGAHTPDDLLTPELGSNVLSMDT